MKHCLITAAAAIVIGVLAESATAGPTTGPEMNVISAGQAAARLELAGPKESLNYAADVLNRRLAERCGAKLPTGGQQQAVVTLAVRADVEGLPADCPPGQYVISVDPAGRKIGVAARDVSGLFGGIGALLRSGTFAKGEASFPAGRIVSPPPAFVERAIYYAAHNHNFYESGADDDIRADLEEAALWGINAMWVWFPVEQYNDIFDAGVKDAKGQAHWAKFCQMLRWCKALGMRVGLVDCANAVFKDRAKKEWQATGGVAGVAGTLVCPSIPEGRKAILEVRAQVLKGLKDEGIELDGVTNFAVDSGGCDCANCRPWLKTYLPLAGEIADQFHAQYPKLDFWLCNWYWSAGREVGDYFAAPRPWCKGIASVNGLAVPYKGLNAYGWLNTSSGYYYAMVGPNPLARHLSAKFKAMLSAGISRVQAYCEGRWHYYNTMFIAQYGRDPEADPKSLLAAHARYQFGLSAADADRLADAILLIEQETGPEYPGDGHHFTPETSRQIYDAVGAVRANVPDWAKKTFYWRILDLRGRTGHLAVEMGTPETLKLAAADAMADPANRPAAKDRAARAQAACDELKSAVDDLAEFDKVETAPMTLERRYMLVSHRPLAQWQKALATLQSAADGKAQIERLKLLMLGDSVTLSQESPAGQKLRDCVEQKLNTVSPANVAWTVINAGVGGETAGGGLKRAAAAIEKNKPDFVSVCYGLNDVRLRNTETFARDLAALVELIQSQPGKPRLMLFTATPFADAQHAWGKDPFFAPFGGLDGYLDREINSVTRRLAADRDLPLCDLHRAFIASHRHLTFIRPDGVHLQPVGNEFAADAIARSLNAFYAARVKADAAAVAAEKAALAKIAQAEDRSDTPARIKLLADAWAACPYLAKPTVLLDGLARPTSQPEK